MVSRVGRRRDLLHANRGAKREEEIVAIEIHLRGKIKVQDQCSLLAVG